MNITKSKNWTYHEGLALIKVYSNRKEEYFKTTNLKYFWQNMLTDLESLNVLESPTSAKNVQVKWQTLVRAYRKAKNSGTSTKFLYMNEMDDIFSDWPKKMEKKNQNEKMELESDVIKTEQFMDFSEHQPKLDLSTTAEAIGLKKDSLEYHSFIQKPTKQFLCTTSTLRAVIKFIRDKPCLWDSKNRSYSNISLKKTLLENFGKTFDPPISVKLVNWQMNYLKKKFFENLRVNGKTWPLFEECKFFLKNRIRNRALLASNDSEKYDILYKIILFIKSRPYFYDTEDQNYNSSQLKKDELQIFGESFDPPLNVLTIEHLISYLRKTFFKCLSKPKAARTWQWFSDCQFFLTEKERKKMQIEELSENQDCLSFLIEEEKEKMEIEELSGNHDEITLDENNYLSHCVIDLSNDKGTQCNLYEEILEEKIRNLQCNLKGSCINEILSVIASLKPVVQNIELQKMKHEQSDSENTSNLNVEEIKCNDSQENDFKFSVFDDIDASVSSSEYSSDEYTENLFQTRPKEAEYDNNQTECEVCFKKFKSNYLYRMHYAKIHSERSLVCTICGKICRNYYRMRKHENSCNPDENRFCYMCNKLFKSKIIYHDHFNHTHERKHPYICCCEKVFMKYSKFLIHLNTQQCGSIDSCTVPDYVTKEFLKTFIESKVENKQQDIGENCVRKLKFWCRICNTNFFHNINYKLHFEKDFHLKAEEKWIKINKIERSFMCEFCNKSGIEKISDLVKHRHEQHRKCTLASYFEKMEKPVNDELIIFLKEPTDISAIRSTCHICNRLFFMGDFEQHFATDHHLAFEKKWLTRFKISDLNCDDCSFKFEKLIDFLVHKKEKHNEWPTNRLLKTLDNTILCDEKKEKLPYMCTICDYYIIYKPSYVSHMLRHFQDKHYQCSCGKKFTVRSSIDKHFRKFKCPRKGSILPIFIPHISTHEKEKKTKKNQKNKY